MTVKDFAAAIAPDPSPAAVDRTLRQVRHWTQNDLLATYAGKKTGSGIPRLYEDMPGLAIAAILRELARYRAPLEILGPVAKALNKIHKDGDLVRWIKKSRGEVVFAQITWDEEGTDGKPKNPKFQFFALDGSGLGFFGESAVDSKPASSILINISAVCKRIKWPK